MLSTTDAPDQVQHTEGPIRVGLVFTAFPVKNLTPYKYFLLLLNTLQRSCEFELFDVSEDDEFVEGLACEIVNADAVRDGLESFGNRVRQQIAHAISAHDLAVEQPDQIIIITGATLSDYHYLIRRKQTTMLAMGPWEKTMAPPSLAEFLQLIILRATYSALERNVWETIHLGSRACIFDFTENLENARLMALVGAGVCANCATALEKDGFPNAPTEIRRVAARDWRGDRTLPGSPANIMARLDYDLFLTKGFEPTLAERLRRIFTEEGVKETIKFAFAVLVAWVIFKAGLKT